MGLKDLTDEELKAFLRDPKAFMALPGNYDKVFDLTDPAVKARVAKYEKELNLPAGTLRVDRSDAAK